MNQANLNPLQAEAGDGAGREAKLLRYLPIIARQDWVAVLNLQGAIVGHAQGDGF